MKPPPYTDSGDDRKLTEATRLKLARSWSDDYQPKRRHWRRNERRDDPRVAVIVASLMIGIILALGTFTLALYFLASK